MELWSFSFNREICIDALFVERLAKRRFMSLYIFTIC